VSETTTTSAGYDAAEEFLDRRTLVQRLQTVLHTYPWLSPALVLVLAIIVFGLLNHDFAAPSNLGTITQQAAIIGTLAIGQTLVILTAGIDMSCGPIMVFASMVMAKTAFENGVPGLAALLLGVGVGGVAGLINGLLVTKIQLPPFIVTLGTLGIFTSLTLLYATGRTIRNRELADELTWLGKPIDLGGFRLTTGVIAMLVLYAIFAYVLRYTAWGSHVYAVGDDPDAARLAGIEVNRVLLSVYTVAGVVFALASWVLIGRVNAASPNSGIDANLQSITAVVIGGTSLFGGRGRIIGTLIGALIVSVVDNGLSLAGLDQSYKQLTIGVLIIVAVTADQWIRRARA
jgi:fructose transport system permease protein